MNNPPSNTNQPANETTPEQVQSCPPAGFFLEPDIEATLSVSRAARRSTAQGRGTKGGGTKVPFQGGSTIRQYQKKKGTKKPPKRHPVKSS